MEEALSSDDEFPTLDQIWRNSITRNKDAVASGLTLGNRTRATISSHLVDGNRANPSPALRRRKLGLTNDATLLGRWHGSPQSSAALDSAPTYRGAQEPLSRRPLRASQQWQPARSDVFDTEDTDEDAISEESSPEASEFIYDSDFDAGGDSLLLSEPFLPPTPEAAKMPREGDPRARDMMPIRLSRTLLADGELLPRQPASVSTGKTKAPTSLDSRYVTRHNIVTLYLLGGAGKPQNTRLMRRRGRSEKPMWSLYRHELRKSPTRRL